MVGRNIEGLRLFLLTLLMLHSKGKRESTSDIEDYISKGVATVLTEKYREFEDSGFNSNHWESVDLYYKERWSGCVGGSENKYGLSKEDGFLMLIALTLNEI